MHTVIRLSDDTYKIMLHENGVWINIMYNLDAVQAPLLCNMLNGGRYIPTAALLEEVKDCWSTTQLNPDNDTRKQKKDKKKK